MRCRIAREARWTLAGYCRRITATDASRLGCKSRNDTRKRFKFLSCIYIDERNVTEDRLKWTRKTTTGSRTCISHSEKGMLKQRKTHTRVLSSDQLNLNGSFSDESEKFEQDIDEITLASSINFTATSFMCSMDCARERISLNRSWKTNEMRLVGLTSELSYSHSFARRAKLSRVVRNRF